MTRSAAAHILLLLALTAASPVRAQTFARGSAEELIKEIRTAMPGPGSNGFVVPTNAQLDEWATAFTAIRNNNYAAVPRIVTPYGYSFLCFFDTLHAESLYVLKENTPVQRGWGTYIFDPRGRNDLAIELPHMVSDTNTCIMGIRAFLRAGARWCMFSGTHRYANPDSSSDMAHVTQSVFHRAHQTLATARSVQLHGFDRTNPVYNGYPEIVISNGTTNPPPVLGTLKTNYESKGFTAGLFSSSTYSQLWRLGATLNRQGQWSNANAKAFVHVEHELPIRIDSAKTARAIEALCATFIPTEGVEGGCLPEVLELGQIYPNPFNPATTINYSVLSARDPAGGGQLSTINHISLRVYDLLGRETATLVNGRLPAGTYTVDWNASGLAGGAYICTLTAGSRSVAKRMVLLK